MIVRYADEQDMLHVRHLDFEITNKLWDGFDIYPHTYVAVIKSKVVGYITVQEGYMYRLGVDESYRRNGIATRLLKYAEVHTANVFEYHVDIQLFLINRKFKYVQTFKFGLEEGGNGYLFKKEQ